MRFMCVAFIFLLSCCSGGTSKVCNKENTCLYIWRSSGFLSTVTVAQLRTKNGTPIVGTTVSAISSGTISDIDPLASDINTTAAETRAAGSGF